MSDRNAKKELSEYRGDQNQSWKTLPRKLMSGLCLPCVKVLTIRLKKIQLMRICNIYFILGFRDRHLAIGAQ
jgi:hypothetical protein